MAQIEMGAHYAVPKSRGNSFLLPAAANVLQQIASMCYSSNRSAVTAVAHKSFTSRLQNVEVETPFSRNYSFSKD